MEQGWGRPVPITWLGTSLVAFGLGIGDGTPHPYVYTHPCLMKPEDLKHLIEGKRRWTEPLAQEDEAKGFKGWYSSKYLPHFDSPGAQQYITYRLADSLPAERRSQWEAILAIEDNLEKQRILERYLDLGHGACPRGGDVPSPQLTLPQG